MVTIQFSWLRIEDCKYCALTMCWDNSFWTGVSQSIDTYFQKYIFVQQMAMTFAKIHVVSMQKCIFVHAMSVDLITWLLLLNRVLLFLI